MKEVIKLILNEKKKRYIYFQSLFSAKSFEKEAKEYGFVFINEGVCSLAEVSENKTVRYIGYGEHEGIAHKTVL